jgi:hypothetical protein
VTTSPCDWTSCRRNSRASRITSSTDSNTCSGACRVAIVRTRAMMSAARRASLTTHLVNSHSSTPDPARSYRANAGQRLSKPRRNESGVIWRKRENPRISLPSRAPISSVRGELQNIPVRLRDQAHDRNGAQPGASGRRRACSAGDKPCSDPRRLILSIDCWPILAQLQIRIDHVVASYSDSVVFENLARRIAGCDGQDIRNWNREIRSPGRR